MLKVFLHNASPADTSPFNMLGRLDIAYDRRDAHADYKLALTLTGRGEFPIAMLKTYPRWTASIWDLVARSVCVCMYGQERLPPTETTRRGAFAQVLTAIVQHWPDGVNVGHSHVGQAEIRMTRRRRYVCTFEDDILGPVPGREFSYATDVLNPWDLLARGYAWTVNSAPRAR